MRNSSRSPASVAVNGLVDVVVNMNVIVIVNVIALVTALVTAPALALDQPPPPAQSPPPSYSALTHQTSILMGLSAGGMAILWSLPPEQSQWYDKPPLTASGLYHRWRENIAAGPVWDGDMRVFNGYGHIHTGAATSAMCLDDGLTSLECTAYASLLSAYWEYGPEALVEIPSWQDLLMTGLVGARVGIVFHAWKNAIVANQGRLLGSTVLGSVATFLLDPAGSLTRSVQCILPGSAAALSPSFDPQRRAVALSLALTY